MSGCNAVVQALINEMQSSCVCMHCCTHRPKLVLVGVVSKFQSLIDDLAIERDLSPKL